MKVSDKIEITNEDNMVLMARYPDNYFDLAIVDPPYGKRPTRENNMGVKKNNFNTKDDLWDIKPNKEYFTELFRISKNQIIWGGNYFIDNLYPTNSFIIWDKEKIGEIFADCEFAWSSFNSVAKIYKFQWHGMLQGNMKNKEKITHPTQKPVALYKWLLKNYATEGDKILDTHLGSMSIAIACLDMGFELTGCELDKDYFDAGMARVEAHKAKPQIQFQKPIIHQPQTFLDI